MSGLSVVRSSVGCLGSRRLESRACVVFVGSEWPTQVSGRLVAGRSRSRPAFWPTGDGIASMFSFGLVFGGGPNGRGLLSQACVIWSKAGVKGVGGISAVVGIKRRKNSHIAVGKCQALPSMVFLCLSLNGLSGVGCV